MRRFKILTILLSTIFTLSLFFTGGCTSETGDDVKPTINLIEGDWTSHLIGTEIVSQIIEKQLEYPTTRIQTSVTAGWAAIGRGDADLSVEAWLPARQSELQPFIDNNTLEIGSEIFPGISAWWVPRYVIEGDVARGIAPMAPDLKTILDLQTVEKGGKGYWKLFENPENPGKGELVGGSPGWYDDAYDRSRIRAYDLPIWRSNQSEAIMMARMISAVQKGEPLLMYLWTPHWLFAEVDLVALQEVDPWFEGAFADDTLDYKSAYPAASVHTAFSPTLKTKAPEVYSLMQNIVLGEATVNDLMLRVDVDEEDIKDVAADWIAQNQSLINQWVGK